MKIEVEREVLHQLARSVLSKEDKGMPESCRLAVVEAARKIAEATAIRGSEVEVVSA